MRCLTQSQRRTLFAAIRSAAKDQGEEAEPYRRRIMAEELGVEHLSQVSPTLGFDTLMARICRDAGDDAGAIRYATASTNRLRHLIKEAAEILAPGHELNYVAGLMSQSGIIQGFNGERQLLASRLESDAIWASITPENLRRILAMLKTHIRRRS